MNDLEKAALAWYKNICNEATIHGKIVAVARVIADSYNEGFDDGFAAARANPEHISGAAYRRDIK